MERPAVLEEIYRYPTTIHGGFAVRKIPGQGSGEIHADGNLTSEGSVRAAGADIVGACDFGSATCPTTVRGRLIVEGQIDAPSLPPADGLEMRLLPNQWATVPPITPGRLLLVLAETDSTSAAFFVAQGRVSTMFRETGSPTHIALRSGPDNRELEIALLRDTGHCEGGIASAICEVPAAAGKEKDAQDRAVLVRIRLLSAFGGIKAAQCEDE